MCSFKRSKLRPYLKAFETPRPFNILSNAEGLPHFVPAAPIARKLGAGSSLDQVLLLLDEDPAVLRKESQLTTKQKEAPVIEKPGEDHDSDAHFCGLARLERVEVIHSSRLEHLKSTHPLEKAASLPSTVSSFYAEINHLAECPDISPVHCAAEDIPPHEHQQTLLCQLEHFVLWSLHHNWQLD